MDGQWAAAQVWSHRVPLQQSDHWQELGADRPGLQLPLYSRESEQQHDHLNSFLQLKGAKTFTLDRPAGVDEDCSVLHFTEKVFITQLLSLRGQRTRNHHKVTLT